MTKRWVMTISPSRNLNTRNEVSNHGFIEGLLKYKMIDIRPLSALEANFFFFKLGIECLGIEFRLILRVHSKKIFMSGSRII